MLGKILWAHDQDKPIGKFSWHNGVLYMEFNKDANITMEMLNTSLPGAAFREVQIVDEILTVVEVLEFSILSDAITSAVHPEEVWQKLNSEVVCICMTKTSDHANHAQFCPVRLMADLMEKDK